MKNLLVRLGPKAPRYYVQIMAFILIVTYMITPALAVEVPPAAGQIPS